MKVSYAYLYQTLRGEKSYSLKVKGFSLKLDDSTTSENIKIENSVPVSDEEGKNTNAYTFSIINENSDQTGYILYLDDVSIDDEINRMKDANMKYQLIENGVEKIGYMADLGTSPFRILSNGIIDGNTTNNYSLRLWIKEDAEIAANQVFSVKIRVIATSKEAIQEGKLVFGETIVTSDNGITQMTSDELQNYVDKSIGNKIDQAQRETLDKAHPIGSIYITEENQNPSELFGGQWEQYASGRTLVGLDSTKAEFNEIAKTGGSSKVSLTAENLPNHIHTTEETTTSKMTLTANNAGAHQHQLKNYNGNIVYSQKSQSSGSNVGIDYTWSYGTSYPYYTTEAGEHTHAVTGSVTIPALRTLSCTNCNANEFSTQDPYITVYMWKRVS